MSKCVYCVALWLILVIQSEALVRPGKSMSVSMSSVQGNGSYLEGLVARKKFEVDALLRRHQEPDDPLVMRMGYMASESRNLITKSLKRDADGEEGLHTMSVLADVKRRSPTVPERRNVVEYSNASKFAELLAMAEVDAFLINTDNGPEYGGDPKDLRECVLTMEKVVPAKPPACICKDIIIHPVQIAQALENGASGVLLIAAIVGADLEVLLDAATIMGTEALVEVHTPAELEFALSRGATLFLVNMWDRTTGILHKEQALGLASRMPMNAVAVAAGNISTVEEAAELAFSGYDSVVLGRALADLPDIKDYVTGVRGVRGPPRSMNIGGMKGPVY